MMAVEQFSFPIQQEKPFIGLRLLGVIGMIGAPALLLEILLQVRDQRMIGLLSLIYVSGWISSAIGLRRLKASGESAWSRAVFAVQMAGLLLALAWALQEIVRVEPGRMSALFTVADAAWPLSHVFMLVIAGFVIKARAWRGWRRVAPILCGLALPTFFCVAPLAGKTVGGALFGLMTTAGFMLLGYAVLTGRVDRR